MLPSQLMALTELYEVLHKSWMKAEAENTSASEDFESAVSKVITTAKVYSNLAISKRKSNSQDSSTSIQMTEKETKSLEGMWDRSCNKSRSKHRPTVRFEKTEEALSSPDFFSCFNVEFDPSKSIQKDLSLSPASSIMDAFGDFLLRGCFSGTLDVFKWQEAVRTSRLNISAMLKVTLNYWIANALNFPHYRGAMSILLEVLKAHCELAGMLIMLIP